MMNTIHSRMGHVIPVFVTRSSFIAALAACSGSHSTSDLAADSRGTAGRRELAGTVTVSGGAGNGKTAGAAGA
jgi:hypothetical protein